VTLGNLGPGTTFLHNAPPELRSKLGIAMPPGPPYVGGSSLIIWKHTRHESAALDLVRYLTSIDAQVAYCQKIGYLPVRNDALTRPPYSTDYLFRSFALALEKGRAFPNIKLSGLLEDRLATVLDQIWQNLYANPKIDLETDLHQWLDPLVRRFELWAG
jgi:multiple sugar transport system substrate-binding protein